MKPILGSIVALVTPMLDDGSVDYAGMRKLIDWHVTEGTDCVGVVGTTNWGIFLAASLGLFSRPSALIDVAMAAMSGPSARTMLAALAVTIAEPPPTAMTASASKRLSASAASSTPAIGLCTFTPPNTPAQRSPTADRSSSTKGLRASEKREHGHLDR